MAAPQYKKTVPPVAPPQPAPVQDSEPTVELIAIHCVQYGGHPAKIANPGDRFSMPITEVDWLLVNGAAKLAG